MLYDQRPDSKTRGNLQEIGKVGATISSCGFLQALSTDSQPWGGQRAIVANCAGISHEPTEITRIDPFTPTIPYDWKVRHG